MNVFKKILIIEDNEDISLALEQVLSDAGHEIITATNGKEGLDLLINRDLPDLILLDLFMPVMGGLEFRKRQLEIPYLASIPVLIMSADACVKKRSMGAHVYHCLKKPFELDELFTMIDDIKKRPE